MMRALVIAVAISLLAGPAGAKGDGNMVPCKPRAEVLQFLATQYEESVISAGVVNTGALLEIYAAHDGLTWSVVVTTPDGKMSCLVAAGEGWRQLEAIKQGEPL